jgi:hypothetical protein
VVLGIFATLMGTQVLGRQSTFPFMPANLLELPSATFLCEGRDQGRENMDGRKRPRDQRKATDISQRAIHAPLTESAVSLNSLTGGTTHWIGMMPNAKVYYAAACEVIG